MTSDQLTIIRQRNQRHKTELADNWRINRNTNPSAAAAVTDIDALLAEIDRLNKRLNVALGLIGRLDEEINGRENR